MFHVALAFVVFVRAATHFPAIMPTPVAAGKLRAADEAAAQRAAAKLKKREMKRKKREMRRKKKATRRCATLKTATANRYSAVQKQAIEAWKKRKQTKFIAPHKKKEYLSKEPGTPFDLPADVHVWDPREQTWVRGQATSTYGTHARIKYFVEANGRVLLQPIQYIAYPV